MNINHALVSAFERSKERKRPGTTARVFTMLLMTVFFVALIAGLTFGVMMYRSVYETQLHNDDVHLQAGLVANTVHANDALDAVANHAPDYYDLILMDISMPEMDGFTLLRMIKTNMNISHIPVVMLTSKSDVANRLEGL